MPSSRLVSHYTIAAGGKAGTPSPLPPARVTHNSSGLLPLEWNKLGMGCIGLRLVCPGWPGVGTEVGGNCWCPACFDLETKAFVTMSLDSGQPQQRSWQRQRNSLIQNKFEREKERARDTRTHKQRQACVCVFYFYNWPRTFVQCDWTAWLLPAISARFELRFPFPPSLHSSFPPPLLAYLHADCIRRIDAIMSPLELGIEIGIWMWWQAIWKLQQEWEGQTEGREQMVMAAAAVGECECNAEERERVCAEEKGESSSSKLKGGEQQQNGGWGRGNCSRRQR